MHTVNYVGVDLSKRELVADLDAKAKPRIFPNNPEGFAALIKALPANAHVVCESTGGYQTAMVRALHDAGVLVSVVMPVRVRAFAQARGLRAKTDPIDARLLTTFGAAMQPRALVPASPQQEELQQLMRARQMLVAQLNEHASHAEHGTAALLQAQHNARVKLFTQQIRAIERRVRELLAADEKSR
jgi:transposase